MKTGFLSTACSAVRAVKMARLSGADTVIPANRVPRIKCGSFLDTVEGCVICGSQSPCSFKGQDAARHACALLAEEIKRRLYFVPKSGEFVERARFYSMLLRPALSEDDYHEAMLLILRKYRHIKSLSGR